MRAPPSSQTLADVAVVIALKEEFRTFLGCIRERALVRQTRPNVEFGGDDYYFEIPCLTGGAYSVVATFVDDMGHGPAADTTHRLVSTWAPLVVVNLGIAASMDAKDLRLGDVLVVDQANGYLDKSKARTVGDNWEFDLGGDSFRSPDDIVKAVSQLEFSAIDRYQSWQREAAERLTRMVPAEARHDLESRRLLRAHPTIERGHLASGPTVGASATFGQWLRDRGDRNVRALDMEAVGVMRAVYSRATDAVVLILRGISDLGDSDKSELDMLGDGVMRRYAMINATEALVSVLATGRLRRRAVEASSVQPGLSPPRSAVSRRTVVRIQVGAQMGTGFFILPGLLVTALHLVAKEVDGDLRQHDRIACYYGIPTRSADQPDVLIDKMIPIAHDPIADWIVLSVELSARQYVWQFAGVTSQDCGVEWSTYAFHSPDGAAAGGILEWVDSPRSYHAAHRVPLLQLSWRQTAAGDSQSKAGYSGSPVVVRGRIVGILIDTTCGATPDSIQGESVYARPISLVTAALGLEPQIEPSIDPNRLSTGKKLGIGHTERSHKRPSVMTFGGVPSEFVKPPSKQSAARSIAPYLVAAALSLISSMSLVVYLVRNPSRSEDQAVCKFEVTDSGVTKIELRGSSAKINRDSEGNLYEFECSTTDLPVEVEAHFADGTIRTYEYQPNPGQVEKISFGVADSKDTDDDDRPPEDLPGEPKRSRELEDAEIDGEPKRSREPEDAKIDDHSVPESGGPNKSGNPPKPQPKPTPTNNDLFHSVPDIRVAHIAGEASLKYYEYEKVKSWVEDIQDLISGNNGLPKGYSITINSHGCGERRAREIERYIKKHSSGIDFPEIVIEGSTTEVCVVNKESTVTAPRL